MKALEKIKMICRGRVFAFALIAVGAAIIGVSISAVEAYAESFVEATPYARIDYEEDSQVKCGVIRYISQVATDEEYFHSSFWGSWESSAKHECGTSCISMALSYLGIDVTPQTILDTGNGATMFGYAWGGATYTRPEEIESAFSRYVLGEGKYSPVIIRLRNYSSSGTHFVMIVGKKDDGNYVVVNPWSKNDLMLDAYIVGNTVTYKGVTETVTDIRQYYYGAASLDIPETKIREIINDEDCVKIKWKKIKIGSGYEIQYASDSEFKGADSIIVKNISKKKKNIGNLSPDKNYYFRIRVYKNTNDGKVLYSRWSAVKKLQLAA